MEFTKELFEANGLRIELERFRLGCYHYKIYQDDKEVIPYMSVGNGYRKICVNAVIEGKETQLNYLRLINTLVGFENPPK